MQLLEFPHSHYCEKAKWALDYKGIPFETVAIFPGLHVMTVRKYAPGTSVPVLLAGHEVVQGSSKIIDYLERTHPCHALTPTAADARQLCLDIEQSMADRLGQNIRRILYDRLLAYPDFIRFCFTHPMSRLKQSAFSLFYPILRDKIYNTYVISPEVTKQARHEFDAAMADLETRLERSNYLVGDQFTRADLSVASMLSLLVRPNEHPFPWPEMPDPEIRAFHQTYCDHPVSVWVRRMYRQYRSRSRSDHGAPGSPAGNSR